MILAWTRARSEVLPGPSSSLSPSGETGLFGIALKPSRLLLMLDRRLKAWSGFGMPVEGERRRADGERALVRHGEKGRCRASRAMPSQAGQAVRESVVAIRHFWQDAAAHPENDLGPLRG